MHFEPVNIIQIAIASPAALAGFFMVARPRLRALGALLIVFAVHMAFNVIEETGAFSDPPLVTPALSLLYGPLFFLFIRGLIFKERDLSGRDLLHLAPFLMAFLFMDRMWVIRAASAASLVAYGAACLFYIWRFHRAADAVRSDSHALRLNWILAVFAGFAALTALDVARMMTVALQPPGTDQFFYSFSLLAAAGLFSVIVYYAVHRPVYFDGLTGDEFRENAARAPDESAPSSADRLAFERLEETIEAGALYKRPHLTLFDLANATNEAERELSRLINRMSGRNFCDYINAFRVKDAARRLAASEADQETILAIAFDAGFSSKSTFNAAFKRELGVTPSAYRQQKRNQASN